MQHKHYSDKQAVSLVKHLLAVSTAAHARLILRHLLAARFGDIVIARSVQEDVQFIGETQVIDWQRRIVDRVRAHVGLQSSCGSLIGFTVVVPDARLVVTTRGDAHVEVSGPTEQMLMVQTTAMLRRLGLRLRGCDCQTIFVRRGKRLFCSERCQKRVYMRQLRAKDRAAAEQFKSKKGTRHGKSPRKR